MAAVKVEMAAVPEEAEAGQEMAGANTVVAEMAAMKVENAV
ncbi:MAG TPA: hypothetical protein VFP71_11465 [Candidatus Angelobacter sp.]|nr:hypothetical protein [Candidatus Angelobacter sp.]